VPEAHDDIKATVDCVTNASGGRGAVAEAIEMILAAKGSWAAATEEYRRPA
jgi:3-deoxy-D-manno-octulosonate 8-phosphate phosphatase KdsC-like HAD superfamily phosphatase